MDLYKILDEFEAEIEESSRIPLTNKVVIQDELLYKYLDQLRANLPEDIRQAQWIKKERQKIIEDAEKEAEELIKNAQEKVKELANETEIYKQAEKECQELLNKANIQAREIKEGAYKYADEMMLKLQNQLENK